MNVILSENMQNEELEVAVVGTKGQIVIPQRLRKALKIAPKTKLVLCRKDDKIVVTKLVVPDIEEELEKLFREIDEQYKGKKKPTEKEILEEVHAYRREKRAKQGV
jgi:AbrB family looped-hinge helix DNA binding protein